MATYSITTADGASYSIEANNDADAQNAIAQIAKQHEPGMLESAERGAMNNFPLAKQAVSAIEPGNYSDNLADLSQKAEAAKAANPISYGAGAAAGAVAPAFLPGVGPALKEAPIAGNALLGAAQGVSDTDVLKHPIDAIKNAVMGAGVGGALGHILPSGEGAKEGLENYANTKTIQSLGMKPGSLGVAGEEIQNMGGLAHDLGLDTGSIEDRFSAAHDALMQTGKQIEDLGQGKNLQDAMTPGLELSKHALDSQRVFGEGNPETKMFLKAAENLRSGMSWDELQKLKDLYGDRAFFPSGEVKNDTAAKIYGVITEAQHGLASDHPEYPELKEAYSQLKDMKQGLEQQLQKEQSGGIQARGFGMMGKAAGMVTGGNIPATLALAGALAPLHPFMAMGAASTLLTNPSAMGAAARGIADVVTPAAQAIKAGSIDAVTSSILNRIQSNPKSLGKYAQPLMQAAQSGGKQGIAATHFLLASQYPDYNQMMMDSQNGEEPKSAEQ